MTNIQINPHAVRCRTVRRIETGDRGYNGSLAPFRDGYVFFYRTGGILYGGKRAIKLGFLDADLNLSTETHKICEGYHTDPRILPVEDGYLLITSDQTRMHEWHIKTRGDGLSFSGPAAVNVQGLQMQKVERNWTPFLHENKVHYIYSIVPFVVVAGEAGKYCVVTHSDPNIPWEAGIPSGGTSAVRWNDDEYITFFHSFISSRRSHYHIPRYYFTGTVCFASKPPFEITRYSPVPIEYEGLPEVANPKCPHRVLFPSGLVVDGEALIMSMGVNDIANFIVRIDRKEIENAMVPPGSARGYMAGVDGA